MRRIGGTVGGRGPTVPVGVWVVAHETVDREVEATPVERQGRVLAEPRPAGQRMVQRRMARSRSGSPLRELQQRAPALVGRAEAGPGSGGRCRPRRSLAGRKDVAPCLGQDLVAVVQVCPQLHRLAAVEAAESHDEAPALR